MKRWQKYWLIGVIVFFFGHLVRDLMQDWGFHNFLSDFLVKQDISKTPGWYWKLFSTYVMETGELILAGYCIKKNNFGSAGFITIFIALFFLIVWLIYWLLF